MSELLVEVRRVSKKFRDLTLFESASMEVGSGTIVGLQGPNGAGKSVLLKMIVGLNKPDSGHVVLHPSLMGQGRDFPTEVGVVIDRPAYIGGMTGLENLNDLAGIRRIISPDAVASAMERVGLDPGVRQKVRDYSLGMKQKLSIAQAFMEGQKLLLLDEAFNGLDESSVHRIRDLLLALRAEGRTILLTSHNQVDIDATCDKVWRVEDRKVMMVPRSTAS